MKITIGKIHWFWYTVAGAVVGWLVIEYLVRPIVKGAVEPVVKGAFGVPDGDNHGV